MRSRVKVKKLKELLREGIVIADVAVKENVQLRKRVVELEENCKNFKKVEQNLNQKIVEPKERKSSSLKKRLVNFFS